MLRNQFYEAGRACLPADPQQRHVVISFRVQNTLEVQNGEKADGFNL